VGLNRQREREKKRETPSRLFTFLCSEHFLISLCTVHIAAKLDQNCDLGIMDYSIHPEDPPDRRLIMIPADSPLAPAGREVSFAILEGTEEEIRIRHPPPDFTALRPLLIDFFTWARTPDSEWVEGDKIKYAYALRNRIIHYSECERLITSELIRYIGVLVRPVRECLLPGILEEACAMASYHCMCTVKRLLRGMDVVIDVVTREDLRYERLVEMQALLTCEMRNDWLDRTIFSPPESFDWVMELVGGGDTAAGQMGPPTNHGMPNLRPSDRRLQQMKRPKPGNDYDSEVIEIARAFAAETYGHVPIRNRASASAQRARNSNAQTNASASSTLTTTIDEVSPSVTQGQTPQGSSAQIEVITIEDDDPPPRIRKKKTRRKARRTKSAKKPTHSANPTVGAAQNSQPSTSAAATNNIAVKQKTSKANVNLVRKSTIVKNNLTVKNRQQQNIVSVCKSKILKKTKKLPKKKPTQSNKQQQTTRVTNRKRPEMNVISHGLDCYLCQNTHDDKTELHQHMKQLHDLEPYYCIYGCKDVTFNQDR